MSSVLQLRSRGRSLDVVFWSESRGSRLSSCGTLGSGMGQGVHGGVPRRRWRRGRPGVASLRRLSVPVAVDAADAEGGPETAARLGGRRLRGP